MAESDRFKVVPLTEAAQTDPEAAKYLEEIKDEWYTPLVVIDAATGVVVFYDGNPESPEDNNLGRHFRGLVNLLNEVDAERLET